jgi:hypothetical protein
MLNSFVSNKKIKMALHSLSAQKPFAVFDTNFSSSAENIINTISINHTKAYDNFGKLNILATEMKDFIKTIGTNDDSNSELIANLITKLINDILQNLQKETAWVTIRAATATNLWDTPRWHSDGYYYAPYSGEQYKIALTLKGPSTLFYFLPEEIREKFNSLQLDSNNRDIIANLLDKTKAISIDLGKGAIFIVGANHAAVHSEPPIHEERLFLSILPGSKAEIDELFKKWYPNKYES